MLEDLITSLNIPELWNQLVSILFTLAKIPFTYWNKLPVGVHWAAALVILAIAFFFAWAIWRARDEWKFRA